MGRETNARPKKVQQSKDGFTKVVAEKSYKDGAQTVVSPDYGNKATWYFDTTAVTDEIAVDSGDQITYDFASDKVVLNLKKVTDRLEWSDKEVSTTVWDGASEVTPTPDHNVVLPASGVNGGQIVFTSGIDASYDVKVSYHTPNSSCYELTANTGKQLLVDYVETQFTIGLDITDVMVAEFVLNNPNTGNTDYVVGFLEYHSAADFLNISNHGITIKAFGDLTKDVNILPWNYVVGYTLKPVGDATTDPANREFNKIKIYLKNDVPFGDAEIATATFYCKEEDL